MSLSQQYETKTEETPNTAHENSENKAFYSDFAKKGLHLISTEASRVDKEFRRFSYKYPLVLLTSGLAAGYTAHWMLKKLSSQKTD